MNWSGVIPSLLLMANSAISLKCYVGDDSISRDCSLLDANIKYCAKFTIDSQGIVAYTCVDESMVSILGIDESSITQSLACHKRKIDPLKGEYCFCSTDNCNDRYASTSNTLTEVTTRPPGPTQGTFPGPSQGPLPTQRPSPDCKDLSDKCWSNLEQCNSNDFVRKRCQKSCGLCATQN